MTAVEAGADALGFVFYEKSPRNVAPETVREITAKLPVKMEKVGVFVDESAQGIDQSVERAGLTAVQLYRPDSAMEFIKYLQVRQQMNHPPRVISVIPGKHLSEGGFFIASELKNALYALLIDSGSATQPGGTGEQFDWEKAGGMCQMLRLRIPTIVAGGLTPENVAKALTLLHPWGVDVSSGVESKPGKKDPEKVQAFVAAVREAERIA